ncbi:PROCN domain protein [Leptospira fluminis]|uniref:PROCN domain protein n=1 Tax=Leptospira fluminis TaxID=2484979 RepID=A0A4R9GRX1_9LEPT|nr:PROCN domain protein [Leptospira fluminis]TGK19367.1 PROCN domain protein [Leptospira fluminis]
MDLPTPAEISSLRSGRKFLKWTAWTVGIALVFLVWGKIESNQSLTFRERKKNVDSKVRVLREMRRSFAFSELDKDMDRLENFISDLEAASRAGSVQERTEALVNIEKNLPEILKRWSEFTEVSSDKLLQYVVRESQLSKMDPEERHPLKAKEKELAQNYFRMAREEWLAGNKFRRDGNHLYSLVLYKRSLKYSLSCLKASKLPYPEEYKKAGDRLLGQNSSR